VSRPDALRSRRKNSINGGILICSERVWGLAETTQIVSYSTDRFSVAIRSTRSLVSAAVNPTD
jgi:hypothetical protein